MTEYVEHCKTTCQLHDDMHAWKCKIDKCIYDDNVGMLVKLTKIIEGFKLVQKIVYTACGIALVAFMTTLVGLAIPRQPEIMSQIQELQSKVDAIRNGQIKQESERRQN